MGASCVRDLGLSHHGSPQSCRPGRVLQCGVSQHGYSLPAGRETDPWDLGSCRWDGVVMHDIICLRFYLIKWTKRRKGGGAEIIVIDLLIIGQKYSEGHVWVCNEYIWYEYCCRWIWTQKPEHLTHNLLSQRKSEKEEEMKTHKNVNQSTDHQILHQHWENLPKGIYRTMSKTFTQMNHWVFMELIH